MKYNSNNKPLVCMQTQSTCYKGTSEMTVKGVLWHSTGANNPTLKRYVQPSDTKPTADTYSKDKWLEVLGKNQYKNDWNHINHQAGLNCWIGKLADGTVTTVQTMPWNYKPWGCGSGSKGSCNNGWIQFEICEDALTDKNYFNQVYQEACEITAYLCKMFNIDPNGTVQVNGVKVPTILCHYDSHKLGLGSNHGDIDHWFPKHGKSMATVRADVAALLKADGVLEEAVQPKPVVKTYEVIAAINKYNTAADAAAQKNAAAGKYNPGTYYIYNKYPDGVNGMYNISTDKTGGSPGSWINPKENVKPETEESTDNVAVYDLAYPKKTKIIDQAIKRTALDCVKAIKKIKANNADFNIDIAKTFFELAPKYGIDPLRAIAQSILETGWFKFVGSSVKPTQNNYCGLGATGGGVAGASFSTIEDGVRAQLQHLYAYGCKDALPEGETVIVDPRFKYVTRGLAEYWEQLAGRWAVPGFDGDSPALSMQNGTTYGQKIDKIFEQLNATVVSDEELLLYFPIPDNSAEDDLLKPDDTTTSEPEKPDLEETIPNTPDVDEPIEDDVEPDVEPDVESIVNIIIKVLKRLAEIFINCFKK